MLLVTLVNSLCALTSTLDFSYSDPHNNTLKANTTITVLLRIDIKVHDRTSCDSASVSKYLEPILAQQIVEFF